MIAFLNQRTKGVERDRDKRQQNGGGQKTTGTKETRVVSYGDTSDWRLAFLDLANNTQKNNKVK